MDQLESIALLASYNIMRTILRPTHLYTTSWNKTQISIMWKMMLLPFERTHCTQSVNVNTLHTHLDTTRLYSALVCWNSVGLSTCLFLLPGKQSHVTDPVRAEFNNVILTNENCTLYLDVLLRSCYRHFAHAHRDYRQITCLLVPVGNFLCLL